MKGQMTVEASFVFPFCFFVIGMVCFMGIFLYNQSVLKITGYESIFQALNECEEDSDLEECIYRMAKQEGLGRVLAVSDLEVAVKITMSKISVSYEGWQRVVNLPVNVTVIYEKTFPERILRLTGGWRGE